MRRTVAIVQARLGSKRLPGKVLYELAGMPMISFMLKRVQQTPQLDEVVLAVSEDHGNEVLEKVAEGLGVAVFRGSESDLLNRYAGAARAFGADIIVRLTGDCPLADPAVIGEVLAVRAEQDLDYCTNVHPPTWPDGLDVSCFTRQVLERADRDATLPSEREHVVPWMWRNSTLEGGTILTAANVRCPEDAADQRWTVDSPGDYLMLRALAGEMGSEGLLRASWRDILACVSGNPAIASLNRGLVRDAGLAESRAKDEALASGDGGHEGCH